LASTVSAEQHENYLRIALTGNWDSSSLGPTADKILALCEKHQTREILMDVRNLEGNPNAFDRFAMATLFTAKYFAARLANRVPPCRFAVIGKEPLVDRKRFEETVDVNRGLPVKTFTDLEEAEKWLEASRVAR